MALINVVQTAIYSPAPTSQKHIILPETQKRLGFFKALKMKMKIGYIAWLYHIKPKQYFTLAIMRTLIDQITLAVKQVQDKLPRDEDGVCELSQTYVRKLLHEIKDGIPIRGHNVSPKLFTLFEDFVSLQLRLQLITEKLRKQYKWRMNLVFRSIGFDLKNLKHDDMPLSQQYFQKFSDKKQLQNERRKGHDHMRLKVKELFNYHHKGSI